MKTIVYSCVTGRYDNVLKTLLQSEATPNSETEFILFTDGIQQHDVPKVAGRVEWSIRPLAWRHRVCNVRTARWHKINSQQLLPVCDYSIWVDGSQRIRPIDISEKLTPFVSSDTFLASFKHPQRSCVYQEMDACRKLKKDSVPVMQAQINQYRKEDYPAYNGMVETACVVRRHCHELQEFNRLWWKLVSQYSRRDQLSFNYAAWKLGIKYNTLEGHRTSSPYFSFHHHRG